MRYGELGEFRTREEKKPLKAKTEKKKIITTWDPSEYWLGCSARLNRYRKCFSPSSEALICDCNYRFSLTRVAAWLICPVLWPQALACHWTQSSVACRPSATLWVTRVGKTRSPHCSRWTWFWPSPMWSCVPTWRISSTPLTRVCRSSSRLPRSVFHNISPGFSL